MAIGATKHCLLATLLGLFACSDDGRTSDTAATLATATMDPSAGTGTGGTTTAAPTTGGSQGVTDSGTTAAPPDFAAELVPRGTGLQLRQPLHRTAREQPPCRHGTT